MRTTSAALASALWTALCLGCGGGSDADADNPEAAQPLDKPAQVAQHLATAQTASTDFPQLYDRVCTQAADAAPRAATTAEQASAAGGGEPGGARAGATPAPAAPARGQPAAAGAQAGAPAGRGGRGGAQNPPPRSEWYAEPRKVFDNLLFLGQTEYTAWGVTTSDGIIVIDPIYDWSVEAEVVEGLQKLGFDPKDIKYVLVSHAHRDHVGGARLLQERYGAHVLMGAADWDFLERSGGSWPKPVRDMVVQDGQKLTLGQTTLSLYLTPGHTPGTVSTIFQVTDNGAPHTVAIWGGTAYNFLGNPDEATWFQRYIDSAERFKQIIRDSGADVIVANHSNFDESDSKLAALAQRAPGAPHPYVVGNESLQRYMTVVQECARVGLLNVTP